MVLSIIGGSKAGWCDDWPQWMGQNRDGIWHEGGIIERIPDQGLPVLWRTRIGGGYSGPAVADGRVFVTDYLAESQELKNNPSARDSRSGKERVLCLNFATGELLWKFEYPRQYNISYAAGPRATPTVDGQRVYVLGAEGDLYCLNVDTGDVLWRKNLPQEFACQCPLWGYSAHPLIHGDLLYTLAGGKGTLVVALNKHTGQKVWGALSSEEIGYCPPSIAEFGGRQQLMIWYPQAICGLDLQSGQELWNYPLAPQYAMSICAPRVQGNLLFASGIGDTAALVEFDGHGQPARTVWTGKVKQAIYAANATPLWIGDTVYGSDCQTGNFVAVDMANGQRLWETLELTAGGQRRASHGTAFLVQNGSQSFLFTETGHLVMARLSRSGYEELGRMKVLEPTGECFGRSVVWSHPAFANRCLVARNDSEIVCVSLAANVAK
ncbi:MAG: PQQ-like beta-propeller repeat protein [Pirellulaceae bacterium]|nr:PQQ-like beta-propeller repeat protein [Pirellulaceae bacterium]